MNKAVTAEEAMNTFLPKDKDRKVKIPLTQRANQHISTKSTGYMVNVRHKYVAYIIALRPLGLAPSLTATAVGTALAYQVDTTVDVFILTLCTVIAVAVNGGCHLFNTYYDFLNGIDDKNTYDKTLVDRILEPQDVVRFGYFLYILSCLCCIVLCLLSPLRLEYLALMYICYAFVLFHYTGGIGLKYLALGDVVMVTMCGPLLVTFAYSAQVGHLSVAPILYSVPLALSGEAMMHSNNTRDMQTDRKAGIVTLPILIGLTLSYVLYKLLLFVPYIIFCILACQYSVIMALPLLSLPKAFSLERQFRTQNYATIFEETAKLNLLISFFYTLALILSPSGSLPEL
ncbi:ubiA prenyltransferase domain-containing protein 1-like [Protopterus annectens]|uniref:ubiA prenyltransferase domain-containing protein 1-like n=1 Tax=Protopterus annectens TaxID=7888 RepID=UPI001CFAA844|nr:ubiA prenyltransferase domain-containing protein 1-like [Protopterus annectens]